MKHLKSLSQEPERAETVSASVKIEFWAEVLSAVEVVYEEKYTTS